MAIITRPRRTAAGVIAQPDWNDPQHRRVRRAAAGVLRGAATWTRW
ncbi:MAG: hypothetical protein ACLR3C_11465 [Eggerthella lenta]